MVDRNTVDYAAEMLWQSESLAVGTTRNVNWLDGVAEDDKEKYRFKAHYVLTKLQARRRDYRLVGAL